MTIIPIVLVLVLIVALERTHRRRPNPTFTVDATDRDAQRLRADLRSR